ncbi:response regulator [Roseibium sp. M-1]
MNKKIALVDDHQMVLDGLANLIVTQMPGVEIETSTDPLRFLETLDAKHDFSLVVTDLFMLKMNGLAFASAIRDRSADLPVLLLSGVEDELPEETVLSSGARGFVSKKVGQSALFDGINAALDGKIYINGKIIDQRSGTSLIRENGEALRYPKVSERQVEILRLIAGGDSNKEISDKLLISENTVKSHIKILFSELGVNKRAACVRQARVFGMI